MDDSDSCCLQTSPGFLFPRSRLDSGTFVQPRSGSEAPVLVEGWFANTVATSCSVLFVFQIQSGQRLISINSAVIIPVVGGVLSSVIPPVECEPVPLNLTAPPSANR